MKEENVVFMAHEMAGMVDNMRAYLEAHKEPLDRDIERLVILYTILSNATYDSDFDVIRGYINEAVETMCLLILFYVGICHDPKEIINALDEYAEGMK